MEMFRVALRPAVQVFITRALASSKSRHSIILLSKHGGGGSKSFLEGNPPDPQNKMDHVASLSQRYGTSSCTLQPE
ncbi:hypothetical protein OUZ56_004312 [Daphnia magna]|uniref:Uncharacterized protein n=1 Tax=Daphnia magna TaxID=35525 RepID=A0ABQ9YPE0_9CRUS|nr:hypothetical protein OUZ56_004312 [Daphnia magna]